MIKTKEKGTKSKNNLQKPLKIGHTKMLKPSLYQKVDKEKKKLIIAQIILFKSQYNLKSKYFSQLKFYHNIIQLLRRIKLSNKYLAFCIIKDYYKNKQKKYKYILNHFIKCKKIKVLAEFYKQHIFILKTNSIIRESLINNFQRFTDITRIQITSNYQTFNTIRLFYLHCFLNHIFCRNYYKAHTTDHLIKYKKIIMKKYHKKIIFQIKQLVRNKFKNNVFRKINGYYFFSQIKKQIHYKSLFLNLTKYYLIKSMYSKLISFKNNLHISEFKIGIAQMFFEEKTRKQFINMLKIKNKIINEFRNLILKYKKHSKYLIKNKINQEKNKIVYLIQKYSKYKTQKMMKHKVKFLKISIKMINQRKQKYLIHQDILFKKQSLVWQILHQNLIKKKQFTIFLNTFKIIHNNIIIRNNFDLMRYKAYKFIYQVELPNVVMYYIHNKLESKIYKFQFKQINKFYKKAKTIIRCKKIFQKKIHLAAYFDSKRKKIKSYESLKRLLVFLSCQSKVKKNTKQKLCSMIQQLPLIIRKSHQVKQSFSKYLYASWINQILISHIINIDCFCFNKNLLYSWLIKQKKTQKETICLSFCYFGNLINLILYKRFKKKMMITILQLHHYKLLIKAYICKLIKAKDSSLKLKKKIFLIKNACMKIEQ